MQKDDVKIGQTYSAKVTGKVVPVRIEKENPHGGWDATNLHTNRPVRIKSAQRLRGRATVPGTKTGAVDKPGKQQAKKKLTKKELAARRANLKAQHKADQENARLRDERDASADGMTASERAMAESDAVKKPKRKRTGPSLIEAAIQVLSEQDEPMTCSQMIDKIFEQNLWSTTGKTPAQTLYSAILREMQKKGDDARFVHVERGKFALKR